MENYYENIPREKFEFAQLGADIHDERLKTKSRGFFADALLRFKKNKSSVVASYILILLIIFAIIAPILSKYSVDDKETVYTNFAPYVESIARKGIGLFDGGYSMSSQSETQLANLHAIGEETGYDPVLNLYDRTETTTIYRGKERTTYSYGVEVNAYYAVGIKLMVLSYSEYEAIQKFQNETGIQVIYPMVEKKDIYPSNTDLSAVADNANIWFKCSDGKGTAKLDKEGKRIPVYSSSAEKTYGEYNSLRVPSDPGTYIYCFAKSGAVQCRVCYYNYYQFLHGHAPEFIFGTDVLGRDLFCSLGIGARFSLVFAVLVSAINLTIGAVYGAIQGFYGGMADMLMDRVSDILSGVPFIVVSTLFTLHLAAKVGSVGSFLFAFVLTGWIGMAALVRKQFYRFKGQEYILAAKTLGASDWRLMFKHIFPNSMGTIITRCALVIPGVINSETSLSYLGIINISDFCGTCIGELMTQGQAAMTTSPHAMFFPSIFVSLLMICFNLFGNGLRDAFNPSTRGTED